ncbi:hypothetical protein PITC_014560 [Penicillium italicum]|uniref:Uncharacterized protein n=1 Tax=Penicillium italicum TaxID=40296 RepID=A0A0A2KRH4_PENIT|nr:hypothetical protein PITC_014560 [Penicillium italicum]
MDDGWADINPGNALLRDLCPVKLENRRAN